MALSREEFQELWPLLVIKPTELTDAEIARLLKNAATLEKFIHEVWYTFPEAVEAVKRYRARKQELSARSTGELQKISDDIDRERAQTIADLDHDDLPESFFETPPIDSDRHIVCELLKERKAADVTTTAS